jgi:hypothetical protein
MLESRTEALKEFFVMVNSAIGRAPAAMLLAANERAAGEAHVPR